MAVFTGLILVFRDFAQREVGHYIFIPLLAGLAISYAMAPAAIATASACAFAASELVDWAIYSFTKKPLSQRVLISSAAASPLDTAIFWFGANQVEPGVFHWATLITAIASKMAGAVFVYYLLRHRERRTAAYDRQELLTILTEPVLVAQPFSNENPPLPAELLAKAHITTTYPVWRTADIPHVIAYLRTHSVGILGGNVQFHFPGGIYDMYWLGFDAKPHAPTEPWEDYVERSARESLTRFHALCHHTDIIDALRTHYPDLAKLAASLHIDLNQHLYVCLDLWTEQDAINTDAGPCSEHFTDLVAKHL